MRLFGKMFQFILKYKKSKAGYDIEVPNVAGALTSHLLPDHIIQKVVSKKQLPMNPHKQRLLVAEAKTTTLASKKPKVGKGKSPKSASSKPKAKVTKSDTGDDSPTSRSAYSKAKQSYMAKLLD